MDVIERAAATRAAFDGVAGDYHRSNVENPLLEAMRRRTMSAIAPYLHPGARVLNLGCGPGTDEETLARAGCRITAVDSSPAMVAEARRRVAEAGLAGRVDVECLGIHEIDRLPRGAYAVVFSNFGPLNCVWDLAAVAPLIARRLRPRGALVASLIGRVCPWEIALYLLKAEPGRAFLRFERAPVPVPLEGRTAWVRYYAPSEFVRAFAAAGFVLDAQRALGLFTPPPYLQAFARRHPRLISVLQRLDDTAGAWPIARECGDHFLVSLRKP